MWYKINDALVDFFVLAKPNAKQSQIIGADDKAIQIQLKAKPQEGEANKALIIFLAKTFKIPQKDIVLKRGDTSRYKVVQLPLTDTIKSFIANNH
jgi:uncharacterized protein (TIGR00251 family)